MLKRQELKDILIRSKLEEEKKEILVSIDQKIKELLQLNERINTINAVIKNMNTPQTNNKHPVSIYDSPEEKDAHPANFDKVPCTDLTRSVLYGEGFDIREPSNYMTMGSTMSEDINPTLPDVGDNTAIMERMNRARKIVEAEEKK